MAKELEDPEGVGGPPVVLVAVEDNRRVVADARPSHQGRELLLVQVVAADGVVQVGHPVDVGRVGDVAGGVEQHVLIRLDDAHLVRPVQVVGDPLRADEHSLLSVGLDPACRSPCSDS
jgi:hypothetical protein